MFSNYRQTACLIAISLTSTAFGQALRTLTVAPPGSTPAAQFTTVQDAVNAAPDNGAEIRIRPATYREVVHIDKPNIHLRGETADPSTVVIVYANGASNTCGTSCSATVFVTGDNFIATKLTIANDWSSTGKPRTQALALSISGDRAVLRDVRLLGAQDTLLATSKGCRTGGSGADAVLASGPPAPPCRIARQFYDHCYIEGEVDFIFGNARAVFHECEIHSITHPAGGFLTANGRSRADEDSGYVFDHCRLTADPGVANVFLGRPWRDYAAVTFLNTEMGAHIAPAGWSEWHKGETERLKTVSYAEYKSTGPGAHPGEREPLAKQLTADEARRYETKPYLAGAEGWDPTNVR
jgi:pectin methylesterase-like acyl-CoA thioesterase